MNVKKEEMEEKFSPSEEYFNNNLANHFVFQ